MISKSDQAGFTLIELLIVVAIIGILAAIAVPNFMNAQVRAKVARAEADEKTIATALEMYMLDNGTLPPVRATQSTDYSAYRYLTTPVAYLHSILPDPFRKLYVKGYGTGGFDQYYEIAVKPWKTGPDVNNIYAIESVGPDLVDGTGTNSYPSHSAHFEFYDMTNGLNSSGDIYRAGGAYTPRWYRERKGGPKTTGPDWI
ncbi:prepilin-type N-terminal cleavage/methylation domain-containing protein [bacterium]|nr:prepilin-type N-terminal cleavage/methylation domain-containing protein [bacterium]